MENVFKFPIHVRFRDIDGMGHVNNAVFFTYFEEGRIALFQTFSDSGFSAFPFILAHTNCNYLSPVTLNTKLSLEIWVKEIGIKSFGLSYKLVDLSDESIIYAKGESVQVCYDYGENKPVAVSPSCCINATLVKSGKDPKHLTNDEYIILQVAIRATFDFNHLVDKLKFVKPGILFRRCLKHGCRNKIRYVLFREQLSFFEALGALL